MVMTKICGITNLEDALVAVEAGCDALGFAFFKKSPRYILPEKASGIIKQLPSRVIKIGVFVNAREDYIKRVAKLCHLNMLQFHGTESAEFCDRFKNYRIIKAFRVKNKVSLEDILKYRPFAYLFDTYVKSKMGGTGKAFNWELIRHIKGLTRPVFLSGGLNAKNLRRAIKTVHPEWVDASSSLEAAPGKKDHEKVREFIKIAKKLNS